VAESDRRGRSAPELWGPHGLEEGKGKGYLASSRQYSNALLGVRHQEEEDTHSQTDGITRTNRICAKQHCTIVYKELALWQAGFKQNNTHGLARVLGSCAYIQAPSLL